jgi:membrane-bound lytic murein transglycosylase F
LIRLSLPISLLLLLVACSSPEPLIDQIKREGELVVLTRNSATTYYEDRTGLAGFEFDLVRMFARELGVKARFVVPKKFNAMLPMLMRGEAHLAAAGLTVTPNRRTMVRFGPSYQKITQQLVYKHGNKRPRSLKDTIGSIFEVVAGSSHEEELLRRRNKQPELDWVANSELGSEELLNLVWEQVLDYTVVDSNEVIINRRFYPELDVAFDLTEPEDLAWAFPHSEDSSLYDAARNFFHRMKITGKLEQLTERYYGSIVKIGFVGTNTFKYHARERLPKYMDLFKQAAKSTDYDWRLIAAMGYQESHWDPEAVSPTGVRGIMMLTQGTARELGVKDRKDPKQSILGGARYLRKIDKRIPKRIQGKDRLWMSLAAYNIGFGHLEDARILTQRMGGDPDKWEDVQGSLPLLSQEKYYADARHGYARGREPIAYVENIRTYFNLLRWLGQQKVQQTREKPELPPISSSSAL